MGYIIKNLKRGNFKNIFLSSVFSRFFIDYGENYKNTVFISSMGRSGSTWLSELINYKNEYREIFEPFNPNVVQNLKKFEYIQYLRPTEKDKVFYKNIKDIICGKIKHRWTDKFNKKFLSNKRIVKDIRTNLLLGWLSKNFPEMPIILLFRHPLAVVTSFLRKDWVKETYGKRKDIETILPQKHLIKDYLKSYEKEINKSIGSFEEYIYLWCILYYIPLKQFRNNNIYLIFYENLCVNPENEIKKLFEYLKKPYDKTVLKKIKKPSEMADNNSAIISGNNLISNWKKYVSKNQIKSAISILNKFNLDKIYTEDEMPNCKNANKIVSGELEL